MATNDLRAAIADPYSIKQASLLQPNNHPKFMHGVVNISKKTIDVGFSGLDHVTNVVDQVKEYPMNMARSLEVGKMIQPVVDKKSNIC